MAAPSKRSNDGSPSEVNGRRKWQKTSVLGSENSPFGGSHVFTNNTIRLLYPASRIGEVIDKGDNIISQLCIDTGAKVYAEESVPGCDERVVVIAGANKVNDIESDKVGDIDSEQVNTDGNIVKPSESGDDHKEKVTETDQDKQSVPVDGSQSETEKEKEADEIVKISPVQKALLIVFDKLIAGVSEANEETDKSSTSVFVRLLVFSSQVCCLLGKYGSVIKEMSSESGVEIHILPKDKLPPCASSSDELVQISGGLESIRKALLSVSKQLLENCVHDQDSVSANIVGDSTHSLGPPPRHDRFPSSNRHFRGNGAPHSSGFHDGEAGILGRMNFPPDVLTYRLLCNEEKVGGVIGKGGSIVKALQHETGCDIKVLDGAADSEEDRIIVISGPVHPDDGISLPQDAVLRVQSRIFKAAPENKEKTMIAKLLVSSKQIGCLLGKGGSVIAEMRKSTGAYIRILGKDQIPKCASENEEVVQVNGEFDVVQEALVQITTRLRNHFFRDAFAHLGPPPNPAFLDQMHSFPRYMGRMEFSPSGAFSNRGPSFDKFDGPGRLPLGSGFPSHDDQPPFAPEFLRPGIPPQLSERIPWGEQGSMEGVGPMGFPDYPGAPQRRLSGFAGVNQLAIITSTTVEVVVPSFVVPAIYGEDGGCLRQIHEISDAKITIADPKPGATETVIVIYGTPEQTNAAQSLIQAFVISETEAF